MLVQGHGGSGSTLARPHCNALLLEMIFHELEVFGLCRRMGVRGRRQW